MSRFVTREVESGVKFDLKASNGQTVLTSEVYKNEAACARGIASVRNNAPIAGVEDQTEEGYRVLSHPKFEMYRDKAGEFRFRLKARNGRIIGGPKQYIIVLCRCNFCLHNLRIVNRQADAFRNGYITNLSHFCSDCNVG